MRVTAPDAVIFADQSTDSFGPRMVFNRVGPPSAFGDLYFVDLLAGTSETLYRAPDKSEIWWPRIIGNRIAWLEYHYPIDAGHPADHWRLRIRDLASQETRTLAEADNPHMNPSSPGFAALLTMSSGQLAYALAKDDRWSIVVRDVASGQVERTIGLDGSPVDISISGNTLAWTEGRPNGGSDSIDHVRLLIESDGDTKPTEIAKHAYFVNLEDDRLVWLSDPASDMSGGGPPMSSQIFTGTVGSDRVLPISRPSDQKPTARIYWPTLMHGFAGWWEDQVPENGIGLETHLVIWREQLGRSFIVTTPGRGMRASMGGGWVTWLEEDGDHAPVARGFPLNELGLP